MSTARCGTALALCLLAGVAAAGTPAAPGAALLSPTAVFAAWDTDRNQSLSPAEFNAGWARIERTAALRQLRAQFAARDRNRDGALDAGEYATLELVRKAGTNAPPIARFDSDRSGGLRFEEYVALVTALAPKPAAAPATKANANAKPR
ncbi:EF-hand domain-containing protein [Lysobacter yangpyeongensis]|uniref:EF-hand domain-containing protein n=1 Tax=Lysobacter yangpyeongensis TaxID=346182 RepID=A0ABW0SPV1_9GAMM